MTRSLLMLFLSYFSLLPRGIAADTAMMEFASEGTLAPCAKHITANFRKRLEVLRPGDQVRANAMFTLYNDGHISKPIQVSEDYADSWSCKLNTDTSPKLIAKQEAALFDSITEIGSMCLRNEKRKEPVPFVYFYDSNRYPDGAMRRIHFIVLDPSKVLREHKK